MDVEKAIKVINRARMAEKNPEMHDVLKIVAELVHEINIARSENAILTMRVEELESGEK